MSNNGGKRIHHLRPARELSLVPRWEPREPGGGKRSSGAGRIGARLADAGTSASAEANGNVPRNASTAISRAIVDLVRTRTGRAPTTAKTEIASELAIVTLGDGLTASEKRLSDKGQSALTLEVRNSMYQAMRSEAVAAVEAIAGRQVVAYLTDQQHDPDLAMIAFVFGPRAGPASRSV